MSEAPERIWAWPRYSDEIGWFGTMTATGRDNLSAEYVCAKSVEYVRADLVLEQQAEIERLRGDLEGIEWVEANYFGIFAEGDDDDGFLGYAVTSGDRVIGSGATISDAIAEARAALSKGGDA